MLKGYGNFKDFNEYLGALKSHSHPRHKEAMIVRQKRLNPTISASTMSAFPSDWSMSQINRFLGL